MGRALLAIVTEACERENTAPPPPTRVATPAGAATSPGSGRT